MAKAIGVSPATVQRIWVAHGLKPHLFRTFKISRDPNFVEKLEDVIGLYLSPPENAIVLSCDEKSQIQALDRTQPSLPFRSGRTKTVTHDYKRNGGRGRRPTTDPATVAEIIRITTQEDPPNATHWSTRDMAKAIGVSPATVQRIWVAHGLKPHLFRTFKISRDPNFVEKLEDVIGLYLSPRSCAAREDRSARRDGHAEQGDRGEARDAAEDRGPLAKSVRREAHHRH